MKKASFLLLNDIHASDSNLPEFNLNWAEAIELCDKRGIDKIIIGGDLFQSRAAQTLNVLLAVYKAMELAMANGIDVLIANGNHDKVNQEEIMGYCHIFGKHKNVTVVDDIVTASVNPGQYSYIHVMGYFPENGTFTSRLEGLKLEIKSQGWEGTHVLYIHEGISGALAMLTDKELPVEIFEGFDKVLVGHYHNRTKIKGTNIEYIGSSRQHNFGEDEEKGYTILFDDGSMEFVQNQANTRYRVIEVDYAKLNDNFIESIKEMSQDNKLKIKIKINCTKTQAPNINKQLLLEAGASKVENVVEKEVISSAPKTSLYVKFNSHELQKTYEDFCAEKKIDNPSFGINYLKQID